MKYFVLLIAFCVLLFGNRDGGPYLGVGYGVAKLDNNGVYGAIVDEYSQSATLYTGAYINKHLSVELNFTSFDAWKNDKGFKTDEAQSLRFHAMGISTLAHYPFLEDMFDVYARFGVAEVGFNQSSGDGFAYLVGSGLAYRMSERLALRVAYDLYSFDFDNNGDFVGDFTMQLDFIYAALEVQF